MRRLRIVFLLMAAACGGDDDGGGQPVDAAGVLDADLRDIDSGIGLTGAYVRVIPGYDTEEECRDENPDKLVACLELVSLCSEDQAYILFTDIVFDHRVGPGLRRQGLPAVLAGRGLALSLTV